jgi:hypothetical protein
MVQNINVTEQFLLKVISTYNHISIETLKQLIDATSVKGCKFINIKGYNSDKSDNTEIADLLINIGISYDNMIGKDTITLNSYDTETITDILKDNVINHNFSKYDLCKFADQKNPHIEILNLLPMALIAMKQDSAKDKPKADNNIHFHNVLKFNTVTNNLLIFGQIITKNTIVKGEFKKVASAPLTVAKNIIRDTLKKSDLRTIAIPNILGNIKVNGDTLELS